jgi:hypothetical protein
MLTTEAQLCNIALLRVGERQTIDSLEETTEAARSCKALYAPARDACLAELWWTFATQRAVLAETTEERDGWTYAYAMPSDCLAPRYVYAGIRNPAPEVRIRFASELNDAGDGFLILGDFEAADCPLIYTARIENVTLFPPVFVDALAWRLASDLALGLTVKPQVGLAMRQGYQAALNRAMASDLRIGQDDTLPDSELISIRS